MMDVSKSATDYQRFCPGEQHIKISDAVCRGRRRTHFPKCHGCPFNDEERGAAALRTETGGASALPHTESTFRAHDICGLTPSPVSVDFAWRVGYAAAQYLHGRLRGYDRADAHARSIVIGRDLRTSSEALQQALIEGVRAAGIEAIDIGPIDTPQLYFAVNHLRACGGIQTTGGAMPAAYNGFVMCGPKAAPITAETGLISIRDITTRVPKHDSGTKAQRGSADLAAAYAEFIRSGLRGRTRLARPLKVVIDAANGMAAQGIPGAFGNVENLTLIPLNFELDGRFRHEPNIHDAANLRDLRKLVKEHKADFGVCFDGDAGALQLVDERGNVVRSDRLAGVLARSFVERQPGSTVVLDVRATRAAFEEVQRVGGVPVASRTDIVSMKKTMIEQGAIFGADLEGRFYYRENGGSESGLLTLASVLSVWSDSERKLGDLLRPMHRYRSPGEMRLPCGDPARVLQEIAATADDAEVVAFDGLIVRHPDWWLVARVERGVAGPGEHGPAVMLTLEAQTKKALDEKLAQLQMLVKSSKSGGR